MLYYYNLLFNPVLYSTTSLLRSEKSPRLSPVPVILLFLGLWLILPLRIQGADLYVSPTGSSAADGSWSNPLDLSTALLGSRAQPGDTIWLRGGTYTGTYYSTLAGQSGQPITVRQFQGERATIDGGVVQSGGGYVIYRDFELMRSITKRTSKQSGPWPTDLPVQDGFNIRGPHIKLINLIVHDVIGNGLAIWSEAPDSEAYGCIVYNNGWQGKDRGHGHSIYAQNETGVKRIAGNILFNNYCNGLQIYGSSSAFLNNFTVEHNVAFNAGILSRDGTGNNLTIGGGVPSRGLRVIKNYTYNGYRNYGISVVGSMFVANEDAFIQDNYFMEALRVADWRQVVCTGNTLNGRETILELDQTWADLATLAYTWNGNTYFCQEVDWQPFNLILSSASYGYFFADWCSATGYDSYSAYTRGTPSGAKVFLQPNEYEPGRATIAVFNWDNQSHVEVDISSVLSVGDRFEVRNAQDWYAGPIHSGTFSGEAVSLPMTGLTVAKPNGWSTPPVGTGPTFNVFVVYTVPPSQLMNVTVSPATATLLPGQNLALMATGVYSDGSTQDLTSTATWSSSNPILATVSESGGVVTALAVGNVVITATQASVSGTADITVSSSVTRTFAQTAALSIPKNGPASPYPSTIHVTDLPGTVSKVTVTLTGFSHSSPEDVGVLLVSPAGQAVVLMSGAIGGKANAVKNVNLIFDDEAASDLPNPGSVSSGAYRPTSYASKVYSSPAPGAPYHSTLSALNGLQPNGDWSLYVVDDKSPNTGGISGGWQVQITVAGSVGASADQPAESFTYRQVRTGRSADLPASSDTLGTATIESIGLADGLPRLTFRGQLDRHYYIENSLDQRLWIPIGALTVNSVTSEFIDSQMARCPHLFYRVRQTPDIEDCR